VKHIGESALAIVLIVLVTMGLAVLFR